MRCETQNHETDSLKPPSRIWVQVRFRLCYMQTCTSRMRFCYNKYFKELICVKPSVV